MSSNTLSGERRWATARRGGMTVLGKVAVPKPLNLPSQRLENHGLDPNVEIVPKGTLSWGSRSSSSGSNAWVSSALSPNADGGNTSPSHLSGRPSSGGSGTRPSTAGSDKTHEPFSSAWGSNSRPSSASGTLGSNQSSSTSLRPRSAETRPNSSQLSRFAEPVSESSVAWGSSSTAERLGVKPSKGDGFSLASGDFPTLGSEKDQTTKNSELQDRSRPSSASGIKVQAKEKDIKAQTDDRHGSVNTWRPDGSRNVEDDVHPNIEKWQGEPPQYFNPNAAPPHFDAWRGPPMNAPAGGWYRGRPGGPAFGAPVVPGGFPMEPFPYYHPQIPPPALAGSQPRPPPGAGPRGPHPKNGELYRPQMPDAYARPGVPFRPGFYPGHPGPPGPMAFESYYGPPPPMGYCNNERDIPYMGMAAGRPVYNGYPGPGAPDIGNSHGRAGGRGPAGKTISEHVEADQPEDSQGAKRAPLKNNNDWDQKEGENWEDNRHPNVSNPGKSRLPILTPRKSEWGAEEDVEEDMFAKRTTESENSSRNFDCRGHSSDNFRVKSSEGMGNARTVDGNWSNKSESVATFPRQIPLMSPANETDSSLPPAPKDSALMQKIEGLNAKFRASDGRDDAPKIYNRKEERYISRAADPNYGGEVSNAAGSFERTPASGNFVPVPHEGIGPAGNKPILPVAVVSRTSYHGGVSRVDHRGKGKFNSQDTDGRRRKHLTPEPSSAITAPNIEFASSAHAQNPNFVREAGVNSMGDSSVTVEGDSFAETHDSTDIQAQRVKMKELAKQRALQLQKEEEERTREQKAKALAKLEELNRRMQAGEAAIQKPDGTESTSVIQGGQEDSHTLSEPVRVDSKSLASSLNLVSKDSKPDVITGERGSSTSQAGESVEEFKKLPLETPQAGSSESNAQQSHSLPRKDNVHDGNARNTTPQLNDGGISRHKRTGYKQKQNNSLQKILNEKSVPNVTNDADKDRTYVAPNEMALVEAPSSETKPLGEPNVSNTSVAAAESVTHPRKRSNRSKNKHKLDEIPPIPPVTSGINPEKEPIEASVSKVSLSNMDSAVSDVEPDRRVQAQEACSSVTHEEVVSRVPNQGKPQPSRRQPRNQQANRFTEKNHGSDTVIWAPVRTHKADVAVEASQQPSLESFSSTKSDNVSQNNSKGKRAEMERYVPKPVAKELAQQGNIPSLSSSISSSRSDEPSAMGQSGSGSSASPQPVSSTTTFVGSNLEIKEGDGRHHKHRKEHGTWRQRGPADSTNMKPVHIEPSQVSELRGNIQQSTEQNQSVKRETNSGNAEITTWGSVDNSAYGMSNNTSTASAVKDQGATGRGKRHHARGPRIGNNNPDHESILSGETEASFVQSATPDVELTDRTVASKENRALGERTSSHWQPKSHPNFSNNQHGNKTTGTETLTTETNQLSKKEHHPQRKGHVPPRRDKEGGNVGPPQRDQLAPNTNVAEESVVVQGLNREKKPVPAKGRPYSPNQDPVGSELAPATNTDGQLEHNISSVPRRGGSQNSRSGRLHESRSDWSSGHDNRPNNVPPFREKQRQNVHYEYQPVGPNKGSKPEKLEEPPVDIANNMGPRYRDKGQSHSRRGGNYHRRPSGAARVDSVQD